jgi:hypothetical protein
MGRVKLNGKRVNMFWHGPELAALREVASLFSLNGETAAIRYLCTRGFEGVADKLANERFRKEALKRVAPQEWIPGLVDQVEKAARRADMEKGVAS